MSGQQRRSAQGQQQLVVGGADAFGALMINSGKRFVKSHPVISLGWVLGLLVSILASGYTPSPEALQTYEVSLSERGQ